MPPGRPCCSTPASCPQPGTPGRPFLAGVVHLLYASAAHRRRRRRSHPMTAASALLGAALVLIVLTEAFEVMVLPRRVPRPLRFHRLYYRLVWPAWGAVADRLPAG